MDKQREISEPGNRKNDKFGEVIESQGVDTEKASFFYGGDPILKEYIPS